MMRPCEAVRLTRDNLDVYSRDVFALLGHCFPDDEREPNEVIAERIAASSTFHAHVFVATLDHQQQQQQRVVVAAYTQGCVIDCTYGGSGLPLLLCYYWQYGCVADAGFRRGLPSFRGMGLSRRMHALNAEILQQERLSRSEDEAAAAWEVWETEPLGYGRTTDEVAYSRTRLQIHCKRGRVLLGVATNNDNAPTPSYINPYVQPRLTSESSPLVLHLMLARCNDTTEEDDTRDAPIDMDMLTARRIVLGGLVGSFRNEGFAPCDVDEAEAEMRRRFDACERMVLMPFSPALPDCAQLAKTDPLLRAQLAKMTG